MNKHRDEGNALNQSLMCNVREVQYDNIKKVGYVYIEDGHCVYSVGLIKLFEFIDVDCNTIYISSGIFVNEFIMDELQCFKKENGKWRIAFTATFPMEIP